MRKLILLLLLSNFLISCSTDKLPTEEQVSEFPTDISLDKQEVKIYDTLTISGNDFFLDKEYVILFESNIIANIIETTDNYIKVEVPENAQSGKIILKYNELSKIIGEVSIISEKAYAYNYTKSKIVQIDLEDGTEKEISEHFEISHPIIFTALEPKNMLVGIENKVISKYGHFKCSLIKINLDSGEVEFIELDRNGKYEYSSIVVIDEKIIAYKGNGYRWESRLVEINLEDGIESDYSTVFEIGRSNFRDFKMSLKFNLISKEIVGNIEGEFPYYPSRLLFKWNINTNELSYLEDLEKTDYSNDFYYRGVVINQRNGNYYLLRKSSEGVFDVYDSHNKFFKKTTPSKITSNIPKGFLQADFFSAQFNVSTSEIIQINSDEKKLIKFNTKTETTKIINIQNTYGPIVLK
jgi:hypothetical protein|tara:strand:- start:197 stop:1423 length:1227 start_codon:yes stop_codon:yes gene_type:complete